MNRSWPILSASLVTLALLVVASPSWAYVPPPMTGHVTDTASKLAAAERDALGAKLAAYRKCSRNEVAVFVASSLDGAPIEDVAYATFNAWKLGKSGADTGVLLIVAPTERRVRIEVGKGLDGALPDLKTNDILREHVSPNMKEGRVFAALDEGTTEIGRVLGGCAIAPASVGASAPSAAVAPPSPKPIQPSSSSAPTSAPADVSPPFFDGITKMRIWMALAVSALTVTAAVGARAAWQVGAFVSVWTGAAFMMVSSGFVRGPTYAKLVDEQLGWFVAAMLLLVLANIVAWASRRYTSSSEGVGTSDFSSGASSGSSSSTTPDPWPSSSTSSSTSSGSSFGSSDNGSSFTGGGGSSGGAGSSDSY